MTVVSFGTKASTWTCVSVELHIAGWESSPIEITLSVIVGETGPVTSTRTFVSSVVFLQVGPAIPPDEKSIKNEMGPSVASSGTVYSAT